MRPDLPGRGTSTNPPNRYEPLHVELEDEDGASPTVFYRDASRTVLAENDSPDVGFRFSLNPYRGCEHGCVYCLSPDTPVLHTDMTWRPLGDVQVGDVLVGFDEHAAAGRTRKFRRAAVEAVWWSRKPTRQLVTERARVTTTAEHRWLQAGDSRWSRTEELSAGRALRFIGVTPEEPSDDDYGAGYIAGMTVGDGTFRYRPGWRSDELGLPAAYWRVALIDPEPLLRLAVHLGSFGVETHVRPFDGGPASVRPLMKLEVRSLVRLAIIHGIVSSERDSRSWRRGFLAGFVDAEGRNGTNLRLSHVDISVLERVQRYASSLGFRFVLERRAGHASTLRLAGRLVDRIRFFSVCRPAIARKMQALAGREMNVDAERIVAVEKGSVADVVDIQTSAGTFFAAGLATHNCYARPSHEYLGFSAGLDFERRIMVKESAPELLRRELASSRWTPQVVALSGNTDCYQPVERRLGITRRCLEVFAEFRNPVSAITKSALVARDADLFAELARHGAAHVLFSITSLDPELARRMEPRAATPERRLEALATVARAGVPVAVMIGPVIPGLNDREIPRILEAAARAGAQSASWVLVRLAKPLDALFDEWLAANYPERRERVLARIRDTRGGRISDSRFFHRQRGQGEYADQIGSLFDVTARKLGLDRRLPPLETAAFRRPPRAGEQMKLGL